ncbi:cobalt ECF transporter T component CbiQ [Calderihabitans maritimus]|uniref:Cobalt ABC transporter inner membrane subunit CbiQ n=1 Tax=Calderihabitans maritimus TaxID=1246530 RepID=A0A1Z5HTH0_9FIRM|nr:cobalt ECF transporter T component CbiQ [Calderihabitans maritimus]GAW92728.1 cobalt ABC transporter inner membrane subunit CbiQ [Calderihabitans maritimus]
MCTGSLEHSLSSSNSSKTFFHGLDSRVKLLTSIAFVVLVVSLQSLYSIALAALAIILIIVLSGIGVRYAIRRLVWILPFSGTIILLVPFTHGGEPLAAFSLPGITLYVSGEGVYRALLLGSRVIVSVLTIMLVTATTTSVELLRAMRALHVPVIFIRLTEFTWRYVFVLLDELNRMHQARRARGFTLRTIWDSFSRKTLAETIGMLFLRSLQRAERVYQAMLARGFTGEVKGRMDGQIRAVDYMWGLMLVLFSILLLLIDRGGMTWNL